MKVLRSLVVIDIETTGVWIEKDKIIEIGMVKYLPDKSKESLTKRVNPGIPIPHNVSELTGITDNDVMDEPPFKDIASDILAFLADADLGGFNLERFDLPILERELIEAGLKFEWQDRTIYDAQKIYHIHEKRDLKAAYQFYCNKELVGAHSALGDAEATFEILGTQVKKYGEVDKGIESLKDFDYERRVSFFDKERKFRWWNGELYPVFGKYARKCHLKEIAGKDPSYLMWILNKDFSDEVKVMIEGVLNGEFPAPPTP